MTTSPRPAIAFQIGLTGHRDLSGVDIDALRATASRFLTGVADAVADIHRSDQISASKVYIAEPPRLRCISGLAVGADSVLSEAALAEGWSVVAALAFPRAEFERDLKASAELDAFRKLLAQASAVCELDGDRESGPQPYVEVGEYLVEHSDLILAIWDGKPAQGAGGTGDVVRRALECGRPVAVISLDAPEKIALHDLESRDLAQIVRSILTPAREGAFPQAYFDEARGDAGWAVALMRGYERLAAFRPGARSEAGGRAAPEPQVISPAQDLDRQLATHFDRADRLAVAYAARYRVAGLMRYGLILPATLGSLVASIGVRPFEIAGNLAQFAVLIFLVIFSSKFWQQPTHQRFIAYRALAEQLRTERLLAPLAGRVSETGGDWTTWLARALVRAAGPGTALFDRSTTAAAAAFIRSQTKEQIAFLLSRASRYEVISGRLSRIGIALSITGVGFAGLRAALLIADVSDKAMTWFNEAAVLFPAMGPVFLGLLSFNEYRRLSERYRAIAEQLQRELKALEATPPIRARTLTIARRIADIMLEEGADWRMLIASRTVSAY